MSPGIASIDLDVILAFQLEQMSDLERFLAVVDEKLRVLLHRALIDAEHAQLADERIVDDLEHVGDHVHFRIGLRFDLRRIRADAFHERRRIAFHRIRQQFLDDVQKFPHARAGARGDETDRHQMAFAQTLLERVMQFLPGQTFLALVEEMVHHVLVDLHDLIDDALMRFGHASRNRARPAA